MKKITLLYTGIHPVEMFNKSIVAPLQILPHLLEGLGILAGDDSLSIVKDCCNLASVELIRSETTLELCNLDSKSTDHSLQ
jgi:hypothetical protein